MAAPKRKTKAKAENGRGTGPAEPADDVQQGEAPPGKAAKRKLKEAKGEPLDAGLVQGLQTIVSSIGGAATDPPVQVGCHVISPKMQPEICDSFLRVFFRGKL